MSQNESEPDQQQQDELNPEAVVLKLKLYQQLKSLPWSPKVRTCELESFLDQERKKFLGYGDLSNDLETLVGLPNPIHESIKILRQHLYVSLADEQIRMEERYMKYPMLSKKEEEEEKERERERIRRRGEVRGKNGETGEDEETTPSELLFAGLLNTLPQYLVIYSILYYYLKAIYFSRHFTIFGGNGRQKVLI